MKLKHRSIRFTFFAAISIIALVFIGILVLLNVFFYQDYYMMTRRSELRDAYGSICTSYATDSSDVAALLDSYESRSAIRLAVVTDNGDVITSSAMQEGDVGFDFGHMEQKFRSFAVLASVVQNRDWVDLGKNEYRFMTISLRDNDQYLCLIGVLNAEHGEYLIAYMPYAYIEQNSSLNLVFLLIAGGCALLICLGCGYVISRQFTRPLIQMAGLADRMSELDFSMQYTGKGDGDEIDQLGQSLNRLSAYLEQAIGELKESNDQLAQEIEEKERIDNMRQEFIVNVSHELKTPIALIQGYAEGLTAGVADDPEDRKFYCDTIADEADHMNKLVMQLLSLSRLELGAEQTFDEDIDLHALCAEAVRKTAVLCENRGLTVEYENAHITVRTDGDLLDQVLMNYLSNAIRYTPEGKHIEISAAKTGNSVRLSVFNEGDGLPEEELPKIWEKFYRTDRARTREAGGTGIGLSLVRAIADTLHGACGAENVEGGICFWFELPDLLPAEDSKIKD
ncbi:sensor histidine kinase [Butyricicoccus sp. AM78-15b2TA]|uniref:sensor histidine kinase n=1 Tax=Butyricicoccus sp. AM78-15b2TA TaxID=3002516 RepID=UPI0022E039E7|nr:HAMP domain-containing sensor histidine kinase [Butyricicoccus sp. AM78-15b2TA]